MKFYKFVHNCNWPAKIWHVNAVYMLKGLLLKKRVQEAQNVVQRLNIDLSAKQRMLQFMGGSGSQGLNSVVYVKSPAKGSVESLQVSAGQYVETGAVLGQLVNSDLPLRLMLQAPLADSKYIQIGDLVKVEGCEITGQVQKNCTSTFRQYAISKCFSSDECQGQLFKSTTVY